jgi:hypothetical protein
LILSAQGASSERAKKRNDVAQAKREEVKRTNIQEEEKKKTIAKTKEEKISCDG